MKNLVRAAALALVSAPLLLASCTKPGEGNTLEGAVPTPGFTYTVDASQFPVTVTFKNTTTDGFLYQWDFGDNSGVSAASNVTHTYQRGGTYKVQLTSAGRGGAAVSTQNVVVPSACTYAGFSALTDCGGGGATSWTISDQSGAIVRLAADGTTVLSSTNGSTLNACQLDDEFSFASNYTYSYDAGGVNGQTYSNGSCGAARTPNSSFIYKPTAGLGQIVLQASNSFIGLTDSVVNKTYDILEASPSRLRLRGTNPGGTFTVVTYTPQLSVVDKTKQLLTNGSSRTWVLDTTVTSMITVGTEALPARDYDSGTSRPEPCQVDDEYTFTAANTFIYDAKGQTFVAGAYSCQAPRSLTTTYTFGAAAGGGRAQVVLGAPSAFIGTTDSGSDYTYRITEISNTKMTLRAKGPAANVGQVFTFKLRVK